jgi:hypothetical protein
VIRRRPGGAQLQRDPAGPIGQNPRAVPLRKVARLARPCLPALLGLLSAAPRVVSAQPASAAAEDPATVKARAHFQNGVKLFNSRNWQGALAEFDAAYRLRPGPSSLKNIALCQKELFRYTDAVDTLKKVLARHGSELSDAEKRSVEDAIAELGSLVGSVVLRVSPAHARVFLDGRLLNAADLATSIRLNTGEHVVVAEAPGYAKEARTIRVAGAQKDVPVELALVPNAGFVTITTKDPKAAIAIDGRALSFSTWKGPLPPGRHYVQVYRDGFKQFEQAFMVEVGKSVEVMAELTPDEHPPARPGTPKPEQRGLYALGALSAIGLRNAPAGLELDSNNVTGSSFGVRAGYRIWTPVGVELLLEGGKHQVEKACDENVTSRKCGTSNAFDRSFTLDSLRFGPNLRIMSAGETLRFTAVVGAGAVRHEIDLDAPDLNEAGASEAMPGGNAKGWDPYFLVEVGGQYNWGHVLFELCGLVFIDGASNARGSRDDGKSWTPFEDTGGLVMGGIGLRAGWTEWKPK